jgi:hypothetical protein
MLSVNDMDSSILELMVSLVKQGRVEIWGTKGAVYAHGSGLGLGVSELVTAILTAGQK